MAQQETNGKAGSTGDESTEQQSGASESTGRHASTPDSGTADSGTANSGTANSGTTGSGSGGQQAAGGSAEEKAESGGQGAAPAAPASSEQTAAPAQAPTEQASSSGQPASTQASEQATAPAQASTGQRAPASAPTQQAPPQQGASAQAAAGRTTTQAPPQGRPRNTSWAEPQAPQTPRQTSLDLGEIAWRVGNVIATIARTLALLFALVLVVNVALALIGVNPTNGVAQFIGAVAGVVILGFRDLFILADPRFMLIVNSLIAAIFWVFVGELVYRVVRFLAARVK